MWSEFSAWGQCDVQIVFVPRVVVDAAALIVGFEKNKSICVIVSLDLEINLSHVFHWNRSHRDGKTNQQPTTNKRHKRWNCT